MGMVPPPPPPGQPSTRSGKNESFGMKVVMSQLSTNFKFFESNEMKFKEIDLYFFKLTISSVDGQLDCTPRASRNVAMPLYTQILGI